MKKRALPLSRVYGLLEPGPVVLLATSTRGRPNVMPMSWHTMLEFEPPLVAPVPASRVRPPLVGECWANLECRVVDTRLVPRYGLFVLEVVKAWIDPARRRRRTIHHLGRGRFMVAGRELRLPSSKR